MDALHGTFGFRGFKSRIQEDVVQHAVGGGAAVVLLPTSAGKSLTYLLPGVVRGGVTLIVSPSLALMDDQARSIRGFGLDVSIIASSQTRKDNAAAMARLAGGSSSSAAPWFVLVTPERVQMAAFRTAAVGAARAGWLRTIAIDEAHCISTWGHEFRPAYRGLKALVGHTEVQAVTALVATTASATTAVVNDIVASLGLLGRPNCRVFRGDLDRPNIRYSVLFSALYGDVMDEVVRLILPFVGKTPGVGIIYCRTRAACESTAAHLRESAIACEAYHGGLSKKARTDVQAAWTAGIVRVMAATLAFGMGIDKSDVRFVVHASIPRSMEALYQESGRAGRDGELALSLVVYSKTEASKMKWLLQRELSEKAAKKRKRNMKAPPARPQMDMTARETSLDAVISYCMTPTCRRGSLLGYFGGTVAPREPEACCDACAHPESVAAATSRAASTGDSISSKVRYRYGKPIAYPAGESDTLLGDGSVAGYAADDYGFDDVGSTWSGSHGQDQAPASEPEEPELAAVVENIHAQASRLETQNKTITSSDVVDAFIKAEAAASKRADPKKDTAAAAAAAGGGGGDGDGDDDDDDYEYYYSDDDDNGDEAHGLGSVTVPGVGASGRGKTVGSLLRSLKDNAVTYGGARAESRVSRAQAKLLESTMAALAPSRKHYFALVKEAETLITGASKKNAPFSIANHVVELRKRSATGEFRDIDRLTRGARPPKKMRATLAAASALASKAALDAAAAAKAARARADELAAKAAALCRPRSPPS